MNPNQQLIEEFYAGFAAGNAETMASCYHPDVVFSDPAFGILKGRDVHDMWAMLIESSKGKLDIEFDNVRAGASTGSANWTATYVFSKTGRHVVNRVHAEFRFRDGLISHHNDHFNFWKWSTQALGLAGKLLGWTGFLQKKIQQQAIMSLRRYQAKNQQMTNA